MAYEYIQRAYGFTPVIGETVFHEVIEKSGVVTRENKSAGHYVQVRFDGQKHSSPCHPLELVRS